MDPNNLPTVETLVRLTRDVPNPESDRRSTDWALQPVIKAGTLLDFRPERPGIYRANFEGVGNFGHHRIKRYGNVYPHSPLFSLLLAAAEPVPLTLGNVLHRAKENHVGPEDILAHLIECGMLTLSNVQGAAQFIREQDNDAEGEGESPKWDALRAKHGLE